MREEQAELAGHRPVVQGDRPRAAPEEPAAQEDRQREARAVRAGPVALHRQALDLSFVDSCIIVRNASGLAALISAMTKCPTSCRPLPCAMRSWFS